MDKYIQRIENILYKIKNTDIANKNIENEFNIYIGNIEILLKENELEKTKNNNNKPYAIKSSIIKYCIKNKKCLLDKQDQNKLGKILYCVNKKSHISLINALKFVRLPYTYVENDKYDDWKDIIIFPNEDIKNIYTVGDMNENEVFNELISPKNKKDKTKISKINDDVNNEDNWINNL